VSAKPNDKGKHAWPIWYSKLYKEYTYYLWVHLKGNANLVVIWARLTTADTAMSLIAPNIYKSKVRLLVLALEVNLASISWPIEATMLNYFSSSTILASKAFSSYEVGLLSRCKMKQ